LEENDDREILDFSAATSAYADSAELLKSHKNDPAFKTIYLETMELLEKVKKVLWENLNFELPPHIYNSYINQLKNAGDLIEKISSQYLSYHKSLITQAHETVIKEPAADDSSDYPSDFSLLSESSIIENISHDIQLEREKNNAKREEKLKNVE